MILVAMMGDWKPAIRPVRVFANPKAAPPGAGMDGPLEAMLPRQAFAEAAAEIASWPGYRATPLVELPGMAAALGIERLWYKDEGRRFDLGSFKALGGAYAVCRLLAERVRREAGTLPTATDLAGGRFRHLTRSIAVATATDGNHGRSVAWGARTFGCRAVIYIHETVSAGREQAILRFGAEVRRVPGTYDDSVRRAAADAAANGWHIVSDTAYEGYREVPRTVMAGYGVIAAEAMRQLPAATLPTHLFLQAGCGGMAAAVYAYFWQQWGRERPRLVVVEPAAADCCLRSAINGRPTRVEGSLATVMGGLACGEVSLAAWDLLAGADGFMTVPDEAALEAMRVLASAVGGDPPIVGGEAGVGGLAGLMTAAADPAARATLALAGDARVLLVGSEADTDPALYRRIVGRSGDAVRAAA